MTVFKLKHKSTGLFYTPNKSQRHKLINGYGFPNKRNLSKVGKIYQRRPTEDQIGLWTGSARDLDGKLILFSEWEVMEC